jgi:U-box domain
MAEASATGHLPLATGQSTLSGSRLCHACHVQVVMEDPVMCSDGHTYSRAAVTAWLDANGAVSPQTSQPLARTELTPNHALRNTIEAMQQRQTRDTSKHALEDPQCARTM